jgi:hypothetical protein
MLEVLRHQDLEGVMASVVRYFGGTKLGAGGLVRAYTDAVAQALLTAEKVQRIAQTHLACSVPYALEGLVRRELELAKAQLQGVAISLLGLFKPARQQQRLEFRYHGPQAGEVHGLERHRGHGQARNGSGGTSTLQGRARSTMVAEAPSSGRLFLITGPSGVGKGTLVAALLQRHPQIWLSISATTRSPRSGEQEGRHYLFLDRSAFDANVAQGGLLEWAEFAGTCYGTPRDPVEQQLAAGRPVRLLCAQAGGRLGSMVLREDAYLRILRRHLV